MARTQGPGLGREDGEVMWHLEVLEEEQVEVLRRLGPLMERLGFYLGGGTGLALYFGHRSSVDLDWFTSERLEDPLMLAEDIREGHIRFETGQIARGTLHGFVSGVRVSFFEYRYPLLVPPRPLEELGLKVASLEDLACMKLSAVVQRGSRKDFIDLYALGTRHIPLGGMLELYRRKYGVDDVVHILYGLSYFDDAEHEAMPRMSWDVDWDMVKATIRRWVREVVES